MVQLRQWVLYLPYAFQLSESSLFPVKLSPSQLNSQFQPLDVALDWAFLDFFEKFQYSQFCYKKSISYSLKKYSEKTIIFYILFIYNIKTCYLKDFVFRKEKGRAMRGPEFGTARYHLWMLCRNGKFSDSIHESFLRLSFPDLVLPRRILLSSKMCLIEPVCQSFDMRVRGNRGFDFSSSQVVRTRRNFHICPPWTIGHFCHFISESRSLPSPCQKRYLWV